MNGCNVRCPYCDAELTRAPRRKSRCPNCGNSVFVRSKQSYFSSAWLTKEQAAVVDALNAIPGMDVDNFRSIGRILDNRRRPWTPMNIVEFVCCELVPQSRVDYTQVQHTYHIMALLRKTLSQNYLELLEQRTHLDLLNLQERGLDVVYIYTRQDNACNACSSLQMKAISLSSALSSPPLPVLECTGQPFCMCRFGPPLPS